MNSAATIRSSLQTWVEITRFGQQACASLNLDRVEETILGCVPRLIGTDALGLYLLDERHMPVRVTRVGASDALVHDIESLGRGTDPFLKRLLQTRKPVDDRLMYGKSGWFRESPHGRVLAAYGFAHSMIVPLFRDARLLGTINLARETGSPPFTAADTQVAIELGRFAGIGITNAFAHSGALRRGGGLVVRSAPVLAQPVDHKVPGSLTPRETEVLELVALGLPNAEIAGELNVTLHTVKQHLKNAYQKLGVRSRVQAIRHLPTDPRRP